MAHSESLLAAFERFWTLYPDRPDNPKAAAREVFARRVREGADPQFIGAAAGRYAAMLARQRRDAAFIPHARTWLAQRRYEDFPAVLPPAAAPIAATGEHPLAWLSLQIGADAWASWIAPLAVDGSTITARLQVVVDHVRRHWGEAIEARLGTVTWTVQRKETGDGL